MGFITAIKKIAYATESLINDIGDFISYVFEFPGCAFFDAMKWISDIIGFLFPLLWLGSIVKGLMSLLAVLVKIPFGIIGGILAGVIRILAGIFTFHWPLFANGFLDIISPVLGLVIIVLGKVIAIVQTVFYIQDFERPLSKVEKMELRKIFKHSMSLYTLRVITGHSGVFGVSPRAFTLGNTIYLKTNSFFIDLLVHESTHVWQYQQTGCRYASDAVMAQWFADDAYNWEKEIKLRDKRLWTEMNKEAQAEFFQDLWKIGKLCDDENRILKAGGGAYFEANEQTTFGKFNIWFNDYTEIAQEATRTVQSRWL
ncbi:hypothetical protein [Saccharicrinis sp. 156]|uniref:hypothetical protein n=1 Tax=Saccharicrinis sp. 156 TaxID=3417574 RepID=UPI003D354879